MKHFRLLLFFMIPAFILLSCQSDDTPLAYEEGTNEYVNQWMYDQMKKYYYWNDDIKKPDLSLESKEYFSELLFPEDRFSYAYHASEPQTLPKSLRRSFGFDIGFISYGEHVYGAVLYVLAGSPAKSYGLQRGQLITKINNTNITQYNYEDLYNSLEGASNASLTIVNYSVETGFSTSEEKNITSFLTFGQPLNKTVFIEGNKKIGYLDIPHFDVGLAQQFVDVFQDFKEHSCNEIILDLRYNGGGDVSSAAALCILLAPDINANSSFIRFEGNKNGGVIDQSFSEALLMNEKAVDYNSLRAFRPNVSKVYILCGRQTASASEIIINNLKPYMDVITIGEKTVGKDMAGFIITDDRNPNEQGWNLSPCIYKLYNAKKEGGYTEGIEPIFQINELANLEIFMQGDKHELLTAKAISLITGNADKNKNRQSSAKPLSCSRVDDNNIILLPEGIFNLRR